MVEGLIVSAVEDKPTEHDNTWPTWIIAARKILEISWSQMHDLTVLGHFKPLSQHIPSMTWCDIRLLITFHHIPAAITDFHLSYTFLVCFKSSYNTNIFLIKPSLKTLQKNKTENPAFCFVQSWYFYDISCFW